MIYGTPKVGTLYVEGEEEGEERLQSVLEFIIPL